ncbi:hypothetical protein D9611_012155 [Ephemerocybe angulata]|uniref:AAA+ ATPase domain-containing protein n=1 Tax=Ephemerocybe angulata TaxID=980116 RepID=A0A8H5C5Q8_9AGAR|nr:hypothetical protein D9611_012155 [Tulosesus angulatus]
MVLGFLTTMLKGEKTRRPFVILKESIASSFANLHFTKYRSELGSHDPQVPAPPTHPALQALEAHSDQDSTWSSKARKRVGGCYHGTRVQVIADIEVWQHETSHKLPILAVMGPAGAGKSTIMQTLAERTARDLLSPIVTFFLRSTHDGKDNSESLATTLALEMTKVSPLTEPYVIAAIEKESEHPGSGIFDATLEEQVETLIIKPMKYALKPLGDTPTSDFGLTIIIDGLDECHDEQRQADILNIIVSLVADPMLGIRVVFSSRREFMVERSLKGSLSTKVVQIELSDDTYRPSVDIEKYVRGELERIRVELIPDIPKEAWPLETEVAAICETSSGHFLFASTALKYIDSRGPTHDPIRRLKEVLKWCHPPSRDEPITGADVPADENPFRVIDSLYRSIIVRAARKAYGDGKDGPYRLVHFLWLILHLLDKQLWISKLSAMEAFLKLDRGGLIRRLEDLSSLVRLGRNEGYTVMDIGLYHKSFHDFLYDASRCGDLYIGDAVIALDLCILCTRHILKASTVELYDALILNNSNCVVLSYVIRLWGGFLYDSVPFNEKLIDLLSQLNMDTWRQLLAKLDRWQFHVFHSIIGDPILKLQWLSITDDRVLAFISTFDEMIEHAHRVVPICRDADEVETQAMEMQRHRWVEIRDEYTLGLAYPEGETEPAHLALLWYELDDNVILTRANLDAHFPPVQLVFIVGSPSTGKTCLLRMACAQRDFSDCVVLLSATQTGRGLTLTRFIQTAPEVVMPRGYRQKSLRREEICTFEDLGKLMRECKDQLFQFFSSLVEFTSWGSPRSPLFIFDDFHLLQDTVQDEFIDYTLDWMNEVLASKSQVLTLRLVISSRPTGIIAKYLRDVKARVIYYINLDSSHRIATAIEQLLYIRLVHLYPHPRDGRHPIPSPEELSQLAYILSSTSRRWYHTSKLLHYVLIKKPSFWRDILRMDTKAALKTLDKLPFPSLPTWYLDSLQIRTWNKDGTLVPF